MTNHGGEEQDASARLKYNFSQKQQNSSLFYSFFDNYALAIHV